MARHMTEAEWAQEIWPVLVEVASKRQTIQYTELKTVIDYAGQPQWLGRTLGRIARYCHENKMPALNVIVINQSGAPGDGIPHVTDHMAERQKMFEFPWHEHRHIQSDDFVESDCLSS